MAEIVHGWYRWLHWVVVLVVFPAFIGRVALGLRGMGVRLCASGVVRCGRLRLGWWSWCDMFVVVGCPLWWRDCFPLRGALWD